MTATQNLYDALAVKKMLNLYDALAIRG